MKKYMLVVTQKVDRNDSNLGFFHDWLVKLGTAGRVDVIANETGDYDLGAGVRVHSLGKERGARRLTRFLRYQWFLLRFLPRSGGVFFHMCPEYVLAASFLPRAFGKRALLWYAHKHAGWRLAAAEKLVHRVFTASPESFRLKSRKVEVVGHGVDLDRFRPVTHPPVPELRLLTVGRIAPAKGVATLIAGVSLLIARGAENISLDIVGMPILPEDKRYFETLQAILKEQGLSDAIRFLGAKTHAELPEVYRSHTAFVHASETGSMDKAVLEALASGLQVFTSSGAYDRFPIGITKFEPGNPLDFAARITARVSQGAVREDIRLVQFARANFDLNGLVGKIISYFEA